MSEGWSLTESDPGIFTGLMRELGVKGLEVEELYGLDPDLLAALHPVKALVFLFKWIGGDLESMDGKLVTPEDPAFFFAQQTITNACASMALLNAVLNVQDPDVELGEELNNLKAFSEGLDPESKGWTISNSEKIRAVHNSFARADPYHLEESRPPTADDDAYHFICYLPVGGKLYELDGLKPLPVSHGDIPDPENWTSLAREVLERRIATHPPGEVMFNLMAITSRSGYLTKQVATLTKAVEEGQARGESDEWVNAQLEEAKNKLARIEDQFKEWDTENSLRRHNYIGLIHTLLLELAKQGKLRPQIEAAKKEMERKVAAKKAKGQSAEDLMEE